MRERWMGTANENFCSLTATRGIQYITKARNEKESSKKAKFSSPPLNIRFDAGNISPRSLVLY